MSRIWGRTYDELGNSTWVEVSTDAQGFSDNVNITWLIQVFKLNLNESPFFGDWGIPAQPSVLTQIAPDYYVTLTQQRFAPYFASLIVTKVAQFPPTYAVNLVTQQGFKYQFEFASEVPT